MDFIKKLKELLAKGWATAEEKEALVKSFEEQSEEVKELSSEKMEELKDLSEENPEDVSVEKEVEKSIKSLLKSEQKELRDSILDDVQKILKEHKEKMSRKAGVYSKEARKNAERKVHNKFLVEGMKSIFQGGETEGLAKVKAEMTTDATGTPYAGYITDEYLSAEIRHLVTEYGVSAREMLNVTFMESKYKANTLATDVVVYWVDEAGSIKSSQVVLGQSELELKKLAVIVALTRELLQEQEIDFISFLGSRVAEGFAQAEDEAFFIGDGSSTYGSFTGLLANTSVNEVTMTGTTFASMTLENLRAMQDATPQGALAGAKYYMHRSILSILRNLRSDAVTAGDKAGVYLYKQPQGSEIGNIDGYPIVLVEAMPSTTGADTSFVLFGDLRKACIRGTRGGIIVDKFNAGTVGTNGASTGINLITTDREAVRWINQVGFVVVLPEAVTKLTTASASA